MSAKDKEIEILISKFSEILRATRVEKGLSMNKLSWMSGVSVKAIDFIEKGDNNPTLHTLLKLCRAMDIPLSSLILKLEKAEML